MKTEDINNALQSEKITFMNNESLDAHYYPELELMHYVWKKRTLGDLYRKAFMDGANFSKTHPTKYFLSDICNQGVVGPEDRKWFENEALPAAIKAGVIKVGIVFDGNVFKMYYLNMILKNFVNKGVPMQFFKDEKKAVKWLLSDRK